MLLFHVKHESYSIGKHLCHANIKLDTVHCLRCISCIQRFGIRLYFRLQIFVTPAIIYLLTYFNTNGGGWALSPEIFTFKPVRVPCSMSKPSLLLLLLLK